jgi:hypothetical protein
VFFVLYVADYCSKIFTHKHKPLMHFRLKIPLSGGLLTKISPVERKKLLYPPVTAISSNNSEPAEAKFFSKCELMKRKPGVASIEGKSKATQSIELLPTYPPATHTIRNSQPAWHMVRVGHGG